MRIARRTIPFLLLLVSACQAQPTPPSAPPSDTAFAGVQARGARAMGFDQTRAQHTFEARPEGGRIGIVWTGADGAGVAQIRAHLRAVAEAFRAGDFSTPAFIHARDVPGTALMRTRAEAITYTYHDLPAGGELRLRTADPAVRDAIHAFLAFQRHDHHAGGH